MQTYNKSEVNIADARLFLIKYLYNNTINMNIFKELVSKIEGVQGIIDGNNSIIINFDNNVNNIDKYYHTFNMVINIVLNSGNFELESLEDKKCYKALMDSKYDKRIYYSLYLLSPMRMVYQF